VHISVIIPVHKISDIQLKCIDSVYNLLNANEELIIVCDNIDFQYKNAKIIKSNRQIYANGTRNLGSQNSDAEYLIFLDSDIYVEKNFMNKIRDKINNDNNIDILNFPIKGEMSNNFFAIYKGLREEFDTNYKSKNIFFGFACLFKTKVFRALGGWPEGNSFDFIMEHEGFQKIILKSKFTNQVSDEIYVNHYHHKNFQVFYNVCYRSYIWVIKKIKKQVEFDNLKSKQSAMISLLGFIIPISFFFHYKISLILIILFLLLKYKFYKYLITKKFYILLKIKNILLRSKKNFFIKKFCNNLIFMFSLLGFLILDILYYFFVFLGSFFAILKYYFLKYNNQ
jgi:glycosyltransferase involved in cell wall biosynthesis